MCAMRILQLNYSILILFYVKQKAGFKININQKIVYILH